MTRAETAPPPERSDLRFCLVVPTGNDEPGSGGGQRSAIFYRAMAQVAPTDVLILSRRDGDGGPNPGFPGARIRHAPISGMDPVPRNPVRRIGGRIVKLLAIDRYYRPAPAVAARVSGIVDDLPGTDGYDLVLYRFFRTFTCCAEARFGTAPVHALDLDDRDDQKYAAALAQRFGGSAPVRWFSAHLAGRIRRLFEPQFRRLRRIWVVTDADAMEDGTARWRVLANVAFNAPDATPPPASTGEGLVFVGVATHPPNVNGLVWFLHRCWPLVLAAVPDARLRIVGSGGWDRAQLPDVDLTGVEIVGSVESIGDEYLRARASISPIFDGGGSKIKVIESCAFARPAICSPHSVRGFDGPLADILPVGSDAASFARRCIELLSDPDRADAVGARAMAEQRRDFSVEGACAQIRDDIVDMLGLEPAERAGGAA